MVATARALPTLAYNSDVIMRTAVACGAVLLAWFCVLSYGLDVSPGLY